ncbi:MAG: cyclomaltodextrinase [Anaerolineales bacterium]|nr:cyclomaltodextrinase [Anaerolineales bacterium]
MNQAPDWISSAVFYHIYPLGLCGAPPSNDFTSPPVARLEALHPWLDHLETLGVTAVYLGPVFEASSHGYDTADYFHVDRRLGTDETLAMLSDALHARGIRLVLDAVFNHVGRDFWAFRDLQQQGESSPYADWFQNLRFGEQSPYGDPFSYEGWGGHYSLVKLNLDHGAVRSHLFDAVSTWIERFQIDGLRLDAADCIAPDFLRALAEHVRSRKQDFWLMGEIIHGDYRAWANPETLHSVTNYECFKGLYSSFNDINFFEIAYALNRQFGESGLYCGIDLYNFADNHDVNRIASLLKQPAHLFPLHILLFTMPGVPSIYYGSEWGIRGEKSEGDDSPLRPALDLGALEAAPPQADLPGVISRLARIRATSPVLQRGIYRQLHVSAEQFAFQREHAGSRVITALNASAENAMLDLPMPSDACSAYDLLNREQIPMHAGMLPLNIAPSWGKIVELK